MGRRVIRIGVCAVYDTIQLGHYTAEASLLPQPYIDAIDRAGALPVIFAPGERIVDDPDLVLDTVDALLLAGGSDVDPARYGQQPHAETGGISVRRDDSEFALATRALATGKPMLGICRGMQLLNVVCGGSLDQHLDNAEDHVGPKGQPFVKHDVRVTPGSLAARCVGAPQTTVMSEHHQGVREVGEGLVVTGRSVEDGIIEAIEYRDHPFALGVLWHPERDPESQVIEGFVEHVRRLTGN
ncbi:gamma-glutamyl-gamma-aminobutyrate hydrolase family protein [Mycolicibacterium confluentis]|uniref:Gamma-glutamyl-gamma-aminobutyrate hydrolase n=1 Tax=Mycolicibacterium confluentis TaxID=28047 RepID=A0A7I7Y1Z8_9MYCO|nr:gamma-glutamyl-gamma-aminobutyrate hydrolase family protein [Mycolicibacterium confluentis]MCV7320606.1 gamma-glutamyl-gamma-aminobutyrate hydrolase family protein [Mycolicibacterium confluentis]ORV30257.1 hypothetical protein AWB99_14240 [Mycolicibacterium confluentis]BBZ35648.1 gamma-glutamyl-gamma-aminobutyrate hydrolase [Mycolicibacterium confluentis]